MESKSTRRNTKGLRIYIAAISATLMQSCASSAPYTLEKVEPQYEVEVETIDDQALKAIATAQTSFVVDLSENSPIWERSKLFFLQYTKKAAKGSLQGGGTYLTNEGSNDRFTYKITQVMGPEGVKYSVACTEAKLGSTSPAQQNAQNLARFIKDGKLELKFLHR